MPITSSSFRTRGRTDFRSRVAGFTLVELLVAVALVLLMMSIFAQIFQMATGSLSQQRGIAENDQRGRFLTTTLRADLDQRTFRDVFPFRANEDTRQLGDSLSRRRGYFSIDENDPSDDTDDVLSLTASVNIKSQNADGSPFVGRAKSGVPISAVPSNSSIRILNTATLDYGPLLVDGSDIRIAASGGNDGPYTIQSRTSTGMNGNTTINLTSNTLNTSPLGLGTVYLSESDPDFDDGVSDATGVSSAAEVCYFLRNNVLYRRVLLIHEPVSGTDAQPIVPNGALFWRDFDYSAFNLDNKVRFHNAAESLSNSNSSIVTPLTKVAISAVPSNSSIRILNTATRDYGPLLVNGSDIWIAASGGGNTGLYTIQSSTSTGLNGNTTINLTSNTLNTSPPDLGEVSLLDGAGLSLGLPRLRFGHNPTTGLPQDGATAGAPVTFRRFNLQECSHSTFRYPGDINPMTRTDLTLVPNNGSASAGLVTQYSDEISRRGEDILMSNVLSFDVKVWDPIYNSFVDVGDDTNAPNGPFSSNAPGRFNTAYAPGSTHFRFDTWHPLSIISGNGEPPMVPFNRGVDGFPGVAGTDDDGNTTIDDLFELGWPGSDDRPESLSAIQIKINYRDISSNQIRQVTILQSLVDRN